MCINSWHIGNSVCTYTHLSCIHSDFNYQTYPENICCGRNFLTDMLLGPKKLFYIFNRTICGIYRLFLAVFILLQLDSQLHFLLFMFSNHNFSRKNTSINLTEWVAPVTTFSWNPFSSLQLHKSNKFYQIWQFVYCIIDFSLLFVCPEPYLSTYWSDFIYSWYKW